VGHTTTSCKKHTSPDNPQNIQPHKPPQTMLNQDNTIDEHSATLLKDVQSPDILLIDETNLQNYSDQHEENKTKPKLPTAKIFLIII
jgi:hypothetical protein